MASNSAASSSYVCDPIPAAKLAPSSSEPSDFSHEQEIDTIHDPDLPMILRPAAVSAQSPHNDSATLSGSESPSQLPARKLCVRHQRMADEGTNMKLQQVCITLNHTTILAHTLVVSRCPTARGAGGGQRCLVQLLIFFTSPPSTHSARSPYYVLLLSTISPYRATRASYPY